MKFRQVEVLRGQKVAMADARKIGVSVSPTGGRCDYPITAKSWTTLTVRWFTDEIVRHALRTGAGRIRLGDENPY